MIGRTVGRYRILAKLGEGGMGSVWKAEDPLLERTVALKFLADALAADREARRRFLREARSASNLHHPGIAAVYDAGEDGDQVFLAFQFIDGETVADRVARGALPLAEAIRIAGQAAEALGHAHEQGVLHRDVTARNIMVGADGCAMVVDFGLALPEGHTRFTRTGTTMGTAGYLAPEVIAGGGSDRRSDLYGLGAVLYEMVTGRLPFEGERAEAVLYAAVHNPPDPPSAHRPGVPRGVDEVVLRALAKDPGQRFQSAGEMAEALRFLEQSGLPEIASPVRELPQTEEIPTTGQAAESGVDGLSSLETTPLPPRTAPAASPAPSARTRGIPRRWAVAGALTLAAIVTAIAVSHWIAPPPAHASVAVLPFRDLSEDPDENYHLIDGIGTSVTARLTKATQLNVIPYLTSMRYDSTERSIPEIAQELHVGQIVVGTFRRTEGHVYAMVALVDVETGLQVWAHEMEEPDDAIMTVEGELASRVAQRLVGELTEDQEAELTRQPSSSPEAYGHYLYGASLHLEGSRRASNLALRFYEKALAIDPDLAEAWVGVGAVHSERYFKGYEGGERSLAEAEASYRRALELSPGDPTALRGLVRVHWERGQSEEALRIGREAAPPRPQDVETALLRGEAYMLGGLGEKAVPQFQRALRLDPANQAAHWFLAVSQSWAGQWAESLEAAEEYRRRFGDDAEIETWAGIALREMGDTAGARERLERAVELFDEETNYYVDYVLGVLYEELGEVDLARAAWSRARSLLEDRLAAWPDSHRVRTYLAGFYGYLGEAGKYDDLMAALPDEARSSEGIIHAAFGAFRLGRPGEAADLLFDCTRRGEHHLYNLQFVRSFGLQTPSEGPLAESPAFREAYAAMRALDERLRTEY